MGKRSSKSLRRVAFEISNDYPDKISASFEENKSFLKSLGFSSKRARNLVSGLLVNIAKKEKV